MTKKSAIIAGSLAAAILMLPAVHAQDADEPSKPAMEQRADRAEGAVKDAWLDGKLETALLFNEHLNSFDIDTDVKNGVAYLNGAVESDIDRDLAGEIAQSIDGVSDVENKLEIDRSKAAASREDKESKDRQGFKQAVSNATLTARVKSELLLNTNTAGLSINVDSRDGRVTLSGAVDSEQEKELAGQIAENASGAKSVDNQLTVESDS